MAYWGEIEFITGTPNIAENYTPVTANFYAVSDVGSAWKNDATYASCTLDGTNETKTVSNYNFGNNKRLLLGSITKNVYHGSDGKKTVYADFSWNAGNSYIGTVTSSNSKELTKIPRYANFTEYYISGTGLNSISVHWNADANCDAVQYSLNGANWMNASGLNYTISGLVPNTQYSVRTRIKRADSQLWTESVYLYATTKDIAKLNNCSNFNLGDNYTVSYNNPSGENIQIGIYDTVGQTAYSEYRDVTGTTSYTFKFTDNELDKMYKAMKTANSLKVGVFLATKNNTYRDYKEITVVLIGNQKTGHINVEGTYKRSKGWVNIDGTYKRRVRWTKVNGIWKRCI